MKEDPRPAILSGLVKLSTIMSSDVAACMAKTLEVIDDAAHGRPPQVIAARIDPTLPDDHVLLPNFWAKLTIRTFVSFLDGVAYVMRSAIRVHADRFGITLTEKQRVDLGRKRLETKKAIKLAFKFFPALFGGRFELDTNSAGWRSFISLLSARDEFTHPALFEHLFIRGRWHYHESIDWMLSQVDSAVASCVNSYSGTLISVSPRAQSVPRDLHKSSDLEFTESDYELIEEYGSNSLRYAHYMSHVLWAEQTYAHSVWSLGGRRGSRNLSEAEQFGLRSVSRILISSVEATTRMIQFFLGAAVKRKELEPTTEYLSLGDSDANLEDRFAAAINLWSREVGDGRRLEHTHPNWKDMRGLIAFRNRITHPRDHESLGVDLSILDRYAGTLQIFHDLPFEIDLEKWSKICRATDEAVSEERNNFLSEADPSGDDGQISSDDRED